MTSLDARALTTDREGLDFLGAVLGPSADHPSVENRFGVASSFPTARRRDPSSPAPTRTRTRRVRAAG